VKGVAGPAGNTFFESTWRHSTSIGPPPGSGSYRWDATGTILYLHHNTQSGADHTADINLLKVNDQLYLRTSTSDYRLFTITSLVDSGSYHTIGVVLIAQDGLPGSNDTVTFNFVHAPTGTLWFQGATAPPAFPAAIDGTVPRALDLFIDTVTGEVYQVEGGTWVQQTGGLMGPTGAPGPATTIVMDVVTRVPGSFPATGLIPADFDGPGQPVANRQLVVGESLYYNPVDPFAPLAGHLFQYVSTATDPSGYIDLGIIRGPQGVAGPTGATGAAGATGPTGIAEQWHGSTVDPIAATGADGDWAVNTNTGDIFEKVAGAWVLRGNIEGPQGDTGAATLIIGEFVTKTTAQLPVNGTIPAGWDGVGTFPGGHQMLVGESLIDNRPGSPTLGDLWQFVGAGDPTGWVDVGLVRGPAGPAGVAGPPGPVGGTLPGGTTGQALCKSSNADGALQWAGPHLQLAGGTMATGANVGMSGGSLSITNGNLNIATAGGIYVRHTSDATNIVESRRLISTNGRAAADPAPASAECVRFGYADTNNYRHELRSVHHGSDIGGNALEILLHGSDKWAPAQGVTSAAINRVARFAGTRVDIDKKLYVQGIEIATKQDIGSDAVFGDNYPATGNQMLMIGSNGAYSFGKMKVFYFYLNNYNSLGCSFEVEYHSCPNPGSDAASHLNWSFKISMTSYSAGWGQPGIDSVNFSRDATGAPVVWYYASSAWRIKLHYSISDFFNCTPTSGNQPYTNNSATLVSQNIAAAGNRDGKWQGW
jgi:hypothetical protein